MRLAQRTGNATRLFIERRRSGLLVPGDHVPDLAWRAPTRLNQLNFATEPMHSDGYLRAVGDGIWLGPPSHLSDQSDHHVTAEWRWDVTRAATVDALCVLLGDALLCVKLFDCVQVVCSGDVVKVSYKLDYNRDEWIAHLRGER